MISRRGVLATGIAAGAVAASFRRADAQGADAVTIALVPIVTDALPYYAQDLGYVRDAGIDAQITSLKSGEAVIAAVLSGAADIGFSNNLSLSIAHDKGMPVKILFGTEIAGQNATNGILTVLKTSAYAHARDLNGATIAVSSIGSTNMYAVRNWLDKNGGDSTTIKLVEVPPPAMADTLFAHRVDAASMDAVNLASRRADLREIAPTYAAIAPRFIGGSYIATDAWVQAHPDVARRLVACLKRTALFANAHKADAQKLYAAHSRFTLADIQAAPFPIYSTDPAPELIQPLIDLAARYGLIKQSFPARELIGSLPA